MVSFLPSACRSSYRVQFSMVISYSLCSQLTTIYLALVLYATKPTFMIWPCKTVWYSLNELWSKDPDVNSAVLKEESPILS